MTSLDLSLGAYLLMGSIMWPGLEYDRLITCSNGLTRGHNTCPQNDLLRESTEMSYCSCGTNAYLGFHNLHKNPLHLVQWLIHHGPFYHPRCGHHPFA